MPCNDITEVLEIVLDADDRLKDYAFAKRSCGRGIGVASLLIDQLGGRTLDELLNKTAEEYLAEFPIEDETEEFLSLKHLFSIQGALEVLTGTQPGGKNDAFAAAEIVYDADETRINGLIAIDAVTERIKSCGNCGSCGSAKAKTATV